jgi:hypothetical protein
VVIINSHVDLPHAHEIQQKGPAFFKSKQIRNLTLILSISNFGVKHSRPGGGEPDGFRCGQKRRANLINMRANRTGTAYKKTTKDIGTNYNQIITHFFKTVVVWPSLYVPLR